MSGRQQRVMLQPINVIFRHLQQQTRVSLWLYDNIEYRIEGKIIVRALSHLVSNSYAGVRRVYECYTS